MHKVAFTKAHGCGNDFLIVAGEAARFAPVEALVRRICDRRFGVGADGVYFVANPGGDIDAEVHLYNSDGSAAELSGNGTRCVAAALVAEGRAGAGEDRPLRIRTGAGVKELRLLGRSGNEMRFEMRVGPALISPGPEGAMAVWVGNPQCVVFVASFDFNWQERGRALERHPQFPAGTNVDFVRAAGPDAIEARFWERGAGHTLASGTGATGSAAAAIHSGLAQSPVIVRTEGGELTVRWAPGEDAWLTGPAVLVCTGEYFWEAPAAAEKRR